MDVWKSPLTTIVWSGGNALLSTHGWVCMMCDYNTPMYIAFCSLVVRHAYLQSTQKLMSFGRSMSVLVTILLLMVFLTLWVRYLTRIISTVFQTLDHPSINVCCQEWWFKSLYFWRTGLNSWNTRIHDHCIWWVVWSPHQTRCNTLQILCYDLDADTI